MTVVSHPIKIRGRFATARDTARALGVPRTRAHQLINTVSESVNPAREGSKAGRLFPANAKDGVFVVKKSGRSHAQAPGKKAKAKSSRTHR
jgi:hypothetical protein